MNASPAKPEPTAGRNWLKRGFFFSFAIGAMIIGGSLLVGANATDPDELLLTYTVERKDLNVTIIEQGTLESSENTEIKCQVRGNNTVIEVVESGTWVQPGDVLVRLDTLFIEEQIDERTKYALWTRSGREQTFAHFKRTKLAVQEYKEGRYVAELKTLEKDLAVAESNLRTARNMLKHAEGMAENGYVSQLEIRERTFAVTQAELAVKLKKTEIDVLENFTYGETLATLEGNMRAAEARFKAEDERLYADEHRLQRALDELQHCVVKAEKAGMVIHPSAARWKDAPEIEEGGTVYKDQILLLMPDLSKMQVKIGIHESIIDRVKTGLKARVTLPDRTLVGEVSSVATVTSPAGWWTGNQVKYETIVKLPSVEGLRPGMSAEVEIIVAQYPNVLVVPVAAVLETENEVLCWVDTPTGPDRRVVQVGDTNDILIEIQSGLEEGEEVVLNPLAIIEQAQDEAAKTLDETKRQSLDRNQNETVEGESTLDPPPLPRPSDQDASSGGAAASGKGDQ